MERSSTQTAISSEWNAKKGSFELETIYTMAKHFVSGNRSRFVDGGYDLDLTYVTERVIAMAFPGEDLVGPFSTVIRNSLRCEYSRVCVQTFLNFCAWCGRPDKRKLE